MEFPVPIMLIVLFLDVTPIVIKIYFKFSNHRLDKHIFVVVVVFKTTKQTI